MQVIDYKGLRKQFLQVVVFPGLLMVDELLISGGVVRIDFIDLSICLPCQAISLCSRMGELDSLTLASWAGSVRSLGRRSRL